MTVQVYKRANVLLYLQLWMGKATQGLKRSVLTECVSKAFAFQVLKASTSQNKAVSEGCSLGSFANHFCCKYLNSPEKKHSGSLYLIFKNGVTQETALAVDVADHRPCECCVSRQSCCTTSVPHLEMSGSVLQGVWLLFKATCGQIYNWADQL